MVLIDRTRVATLAAAAIGAGAFLALGLPLPLLLGPMFGCLALALAGAKLEGMGRVETPMRTMLGVAIGCSITPAMLIELPGYGPTLLLVPIYIAVIALIGYPLFRFRCGFDRATAYYSAMPGGLQDMLVFGEEAGGNARTLSLIHATRVLVIVTVAPFALTLFYDIDLSAPPGARAEELPPLQIALMLIAGIVGWQAAKRLRVFGASIIGPMILAGALSLAGAIDNRPPAELIWLAQFFIGLSVGAKYAGVTALELRRVVGAGLIYSLALAAASLVFIEIAVLISPAPSLDLILAFLPGGQAEMTVVALAAGADVAFIVAHHLLRLIIVLTLAPATSRWFGVGRD